ncbi:MAG TPA: tRNA epoxyqueuosine(34) reductase QueG [Gemmatimonadales bacterium]|nr:tRNA epoxyqueuosine(34) reductase QueG [Gemmatimonadales bacterium]
MNPVERSVEVKRRGTALGFDAVGITTLESNPHAAELERWLAAGHAGTMTYLQRQAAKRKDPRRIMTGAKVAVVTLTNYFHGYPQESRSLTDPGRKPGDYHNPPEGSVSTPGWSVSLNPGLASGVSPPSKGPRVAQYAWSSDYHDVLGARLERLAAAIREVVPGAATRAYVDAGPVPERELAQRAGLGWIAKNMMLIHPELGSFTFIGVVLTDAPLASDLPFEADRCGTCRRCLDACPTHAFVAPGDLDARRCISYLTIEHRGPFSDDQRRDVGEWVFGCDVCQDVCPWNVSFARATADAELAPRADVAAPDLRALLDMDEQEFARRYGDTPFARPGLAGMRRNAAAVRAARTGA